MRNSLKKSVEHSPAQGFERYQKGSIVLCNACSKPIFKLDAAISIGDKSGQLARAFKPFAVADLLTLASREDIDGGILALVRSMTLAQMHAHVALLKEMKTGDPMMCPSCGDCFVQVVSVDHDEVMDKSYTIELLTVPPEGRGKASPVRGKSIGFNKDWVN